MRARVVAFVALLTLPVALSAQILRRPPVGRNPTPSPVPLPPTAEPVARALQYHQSRWSAEGYSLFTNVRVATPNGVANYTNVGAGTHGGYRFGDHFSGTADLTSSFDGSPTETQTAEVGARYAPAPFEQQVRPFFDVRGSYLHMSDTFFSANNTVSPVGDYATTRYARGFGGIVGTGFEISLTNSFALSTELSAMRGRMTAYRVNGPADFPNASAYWLTQYRLALGLKYSARRVTALRQNPH